VRIAIDVRRIRDFGIGTYIRNLLRALGQIDREGEYLLIGPPGEQKQFRDLPANFRFIAHKTSDLQRSDHFAFPWLLRKLEVDLTHVPLTRVPLLLQRPYVVTVHDLSNMLFDQSTAIVQQMRRFRFIRGVSRAARIIAVSSATRRDLENMIESVSGRTRVIYNAPDPSFFYSGRAADARAAGPESGVLERRRIVERYQINYPFLLYVGHIRAQKNIPRLIEGFAVARQQLSSDAKFDALRLLIIGEEIYKYPEVRRAIIHSRVEHCVRFLGFVPFDTLRVIYELATAFLFPSLYEGFGLPPLEAMASGTPVIASNVSSLPEVVGDAACIVNPENVFDIARGICDVLRDEELRNTLVVKGRARAANFSWLASAKETLETYREAVNS
jgi:glycosyltransferase involved in cell wall biosynthesis